MADIAKLRQLAEQLKRDPNEWLEWVCATRPPDVLPLLDVVEAAKEIDEATGIVEAAMLVSSGRLRRALSRLEEAP